MHFAYIGEGEETDAFGLRFPRGASVEVTDAHAVKKLSNNAQFVAVFDGVEVLDALPELQPKRRGRPPKAKP